MKVLPVRKSWCSMLLRLLQAYGAAASVLFLTDNSEPQVVSLLVFLLMFWLLPYGDAGNHKRLRTVAEIFAVFFAAASVLANYAWLVKNYALFSTYTVYIFLCLWSFYFALLRLLYLRLLKATPFALNPVDKLSPGGLFLAVFVLLLVGYTFVFLCHYPGNVMADMRTQLAQIAGLDPYSNHHPMAHTMGMKVFFDLGVALFGNQNAGVACICVSQYVAAAAVYAFLASTMRYFHVKPGVIAATVLFFAVVPHNMLFAITMVKDIPFALMVLLLCTVLWRMLAPGGALRQKGIRIVNWTLLAVSSIGVCVLRTNGVYAFIALLLVMVFLLRKNQLILLPVMAGALCLSLLYRGPVLNALGVAPTETVEALSIPAQHIARVITDGCALTEEETALLDKIVDVKKVPETYESYISDPIKALIQQSGGEAYLREHAGDYLKLWLKLGLRYPKEYLYAQIDTTVGFWYPNIEYESMYLEGIHPETTRLSISTEPVITGEPARLLHAWFTGSRIWPVFGLVFQIGMATWVAVALFGFAIVQKRRAALLPYILVLLVFGTLMVATPVHAEFRYLYALYVCLPLLFLLPYCNLGEDGGN